ncbi:MAG: molybdopterin molybdotransferase MoeA [Spirochaetes bacterium]|nr:molybdopterin molybdotransferase MoeA [Spirochaetota bacterium]
MRLFNVLSPEEVRRIIRTTVAPLPSEIVPIDQAGGRVCSERVLSPEDLPSFTRSTVDGYAVYSQDTFGASDAAPALLNLVGEVRIGELAPSMERGSTIYVPTGGMLPEGADAVVMVEYTDVLGDLIQVLRPVSPGENVIVKGEDFRKGDLVLEPGRVIRAQEIGALSALGVHRIAVHVRPKVAVLSTGNELVPYETISLRAGKVRDCNAPMLMELCRKKGALPRYLGILEDDPTEFRVAIQKALQDSNCVVLSGGSSVGTRDFTASILDELSGGNLLVEGVAIQPGKPLLLAVCQGKPVLGLPGHPVSALSSFLLFGSYILDRLQGRETPEYHPSVQAELALNVPSKPGRTDVVRVKLSRAVGTCRGVSKGTVEWQAIPLFGRSGVLHTLTEADGFILVPPDKEGLQEGEFVDVLLYGYTQYE